MRRLAYGLNTSFSPYFTLKTTISPYFLIGNGHLRALYPIENAHSPPASIRNVSHLGYDIQTSSCYGARLTGRLFVVKNRLPPSFESLPPEPLLTEEDLLAPCLAGILWFSSCFSLAFTVLQ